MCKIRVCHFSPHNVAVPIATSLFSSPGDARSDFISATITTPCECDPGASLDLLEHNSRGGDRDVMGCLWHECCVIAYQPVVCQWYWDLSEDLQIEYVQTTLVEMECPNSFTAHEYYPIGMVLDHVDEKQDGSGGRVRLPGFNVWGQMRADLAAFPAAELFYSWRVYEDAVAGPASLGLFDDRREVEKHGQQLWKQKAELINTIARAEVNLEWLEESLSDVAGIQWFGEDPMMVLRMMRWVQTLLRQAQREELEAAESFRGMMRHAGFVFTVLGKMPSIGESVTAAKGSYSISRAQLDLARLGPQGIIDACDGPLKQVSGFKRRMQQVQKVLSLPKKLQSPCTRDLRRGVPISAMRRSKIRRHR